MKGSIAVTLISLGGILGAQLSTPAAADMVDISAAPIFVYAAGDIACAPGDVVDATHCQFAATADLIRNDPNFSATTSKILGLGDDQYDNGEFANYNSVYDVTWGATPPSPKIAFKTQTRPSIGNHQYDDPAGPGQGYKQYWGGQAKWSTNCIPPATGCAYYSYDVGSAWHVVVLNTECDQFPTAPSCAGELTWLNNDLASSTRTCEIVYGHRPRWAKGGNYGYLDAMWDVAVAQGVDLWLAGHIHNYQRYPQMDGSGNAVSSGVREVVVGTGGKNHQSISATGGPPATADFTDGVSTHFEVLRLSLASTGYSGALLDIGGTIVDTFPATGTVSCHP